MNNAESARKRSKILIIGLDGVTFDVLNPVIGDGVLPFLGKENQEWGLWPARDRFSTGDCPRICLLLDWYECGEAWCIRVSFPSTC